MKMYGFRLKFHWSLLLGSNQQYSVIGSENGLAPIRQQAIIWTNDGIGYWCIYASLDLNELNSIVPADGLATADDQLY